MKNKSILQTLRNLLNRCSSFIISAALWVIVTGVATHNFSANSYSSSTLLGVASGLGVVTAIWLAYSLARSK